MNGPDFDFDHWRKLAQTAPDEFERQRRAAVDRLIEDCNGTRQLKGLQCRIDLERARTRTPMKSCLRLSSLMWEQFLDFNNILHDWTLAKAGGATSATMGQVIPFSPAGTRSPGTEAGRR